VSGFPLIDCTMGRGSSFRSPLLASVGLALVTLAVVLLVAEGVARLLWEPHRPPVRRARPDSWEELPELKGMFSLSKPNVRGLFRGVLFETNSLGFRGPERAPVKPPGTFRIALTGDSIAMGSGVLQEDTYAARLERLLDEERSDHEYEVLNVALAGANTREAVRRFAKLALPLDPDMLVYGYTLNDIEGPNYRKSMTYRYIDPDAFRTSASYLMRSLGPRWDSLLELLFAPRGSYGFELDDNYFRNEAAWSQVTEGLDRLAELAGKRRLCSVLLVHTRLYSLNFLHPYRRHYAQVARAAEDRGFHPILSHPYFMGNEARSFWVWAQDPHPNAAGHERLFEALVAGLEDLPAACWSSQPGSRPGP